MTVRRRSRPLRLTARGGRARWRRLVRHRKAESERYQQLIIAERAGKIRALVLQPAWPLIVEGVKVATYRADFSYIDVATDTEVVEDVKGMSTPVYKLKKKMMAAFYGIEIQEIRA